MDQLSIGPTVALKNDELALYGPKFTKSIGYEDKNQNEVKRRSVKDVSKRIKEARANFTVDLEESKLDAAKLDEVEPRGRSRDRPKEEDANKITLRVQYCGKCTLIEKKALEIKSLVKGICDVEFVKDVDRTNNLKVTLGKSIIFDKKN
jgi:hypothetical protein